MIRSWTIGAACALGVWLGAGAANAGWLRLCNDGAADLGFAYAQGHTGIVSSIRQRVTGFLSLPAGDCITHHRQPGTAWALAFVARDSRRRLTPIEIDFRGPRRGWTADALCGPDIQSGVLDFSYMANGSMASLGRACIGRHPMSYPVSSTFVFGDNDARVTVGRGLSDVDALADAFYSGRPPEEEVARQRAAREAEAARRRAEALRREREEADRRREEEAARARRDDAMRETMRRAREANATSDTPVVELQFLAGPCRGGAARSFAFHLFIPRPGGGFRTETVIHMPGIRTATGHRKRLEIPRAEDGTLSLYWSAELFEAVHPSQDPTPVAIPGDTPVAVPGRGTLMLNRLELTPNGLGRLRVSCVLPETRAADRTRARAEAVAGWTSDDPDALDRFADALLAAGMSEAARSNAILSRIVGRHFAPAAGPARAEILGRLGEAALLPGEPADESTFVLTRDLPFYRDLAFAYVVRPSRAAPLMIPVLYDPDAPDVAFHVLDGTNEPVYLSTVAAVGSGGFVLDDETASAYATFFFTVVEGRHGRFLPLASSEPFGDRLREPVRRDVDAAISRCAANRATDEAAARLLSLPFLFQGSLYCGAVRVSDRGLVEIVSTEVLREGLPAIGGSAEIALGGAEGGRRP